MITLEQYKKLRKQGLSSQEIQQMDRASVDKNWGDKVWDFIDKAGKTVSSVFPGAVIGEQLGHSIASIITPPEKRKFLGEPPSVLRQAADLGQIGLTIAAPLKAPAKTIAGRIGFGTAIGAGTGAIQTLKEEEPSGIVGKTIGGAVIGAGISGAFEIVGAGVRALSNTNFAQKLLGTSYTKALQPQTKELAKQIERGFKTTGERIAKEGYVGGLEKMRQQAVSNMKMYGKQLDSVLEKYPNVKVFKSQIIGKSADDLADVFGALTKQQKATIQREAAKLPQSTNLKDLLGLKRQLDKKISPTFWIEADPKKSFVQWVNYTFRRNAKELIETSTNDQLVRSINQKLGMAVDVRELTSLQQALRQKGGTIVPMGKYSLITNMLNRTIFNPAITTRAAQTLTTAGQKTGQTPLRQTLRAGTIIGTQGLLKKE